MMIAAATEARAASELQRSDVSPGQSFEVIHQALNLLRGYQLQDR